MVKHLVAHLITKRHQGHLESGLRFVRFSFNARYIYPPIAM